MKAQVNCASKPCIGCEFQWRLPPVPAHAECKQTVCELVGDLCLGQAQRTRLLDVVEVGMVGHKCPCFCQRCDVGDILQILLAALQLNGEVHWRRRSSCRRLSCGLPTRSDLRRHGCRRAHSVSEHSLTSHKLQTPGNQKSFATRTKSTARASTPEERAAYLDIETDAIQETPNVHYNSESNVINCGPVFPSTRLTTALLVVSDPGAKKRQKAPKNAKKRQKAPNLSHRKRRQKAPKNAKKRQKTPKNAKKSFANAKYGLRLIVDNMNFLYVFLMTSCSEHTIWLDSQNEDIFQKN